MKPLLVLAVLSVVLTGCSGSGAAGQVEFPQSGYPATVASQAAVARLARNPLSQAPARTPQPKPTPLTLTGSLMLVAYDDGRSSEFLMGGIDTAGTGGHTCAGTGSYEGVREGVRVEVGDAGGRTLASGELGGGRSGTLSGGEPGSDLEWLGQDALTCTFTYRVVGLPRAQSYTIEVADRGQVSFSVAELETLGWEADLSLSSYYDLRMIIPGPS